MTLAIVTVAVVALGGAVAIYIASRRLKSAKTLDVLFLLWLFVLAVSVSVMIVSLESGKVRVLAIVPLLLWSVAAYVFWRKHG